MISGGLSFTVVRTRTEVLQRFLSSWDIKMSFFSRLGSLDYRKRSWINTSLWLIIYDSATLWFWPKPFAHGKCTRHMDILFCNRPYKDKRLLYCCTFLHMTDDKLCCECRSRQRSASLFLLPLMNSQSTQLSLREQYSCTTDVDSPYIQEDNSIGTGSLKFNAFFLSYKPALRSI